MPCGLLSPSGVPRRHANERAGAPTESVRTPPPLLSARTCVSRCEFVPRWPHESLPGDCLQPFEHALPELHIHDRQDAPLSTRNPECRNPDRMVHSGLYEHRPDYYHKPLAHVSLELHILPLPRTRPVHLHEDTLEPPFGSSLRRWVGRGRRPRRLGRFLKVRCTEGESGRVTLRPSLTHMTPGTLGWLHPESQTPRP